MARILIAEDDPTFQKLLYRIIQKMGHTPFVSPNGKHAWEALQASNNFDLLVSDLAMPEMDGKQLVKTIRGHTEFKNIPIIVISAVIGISEIKDILELGATSFLGKPINRSDFEEEISMLLKSTNGS